MYARFFLRPLVLGAVVGALTAGSVRAWIALSLQDGAVVNLSVQTTQAACGAPFFQIGTRGPVTNVGSVSASLSTDNPSVCTTYGNRYYVMVAASTGGACGNVPTAIAGYLTYTKGVNTSVVQPGPHFFGESNGYSSDCDPGQWIYGSVSGTNTYRVDVHSINDIQCDAPAHADMYLNATLQLSTCIDWDVGSAVQMAALNGDFQNNYLTDASGVTWSNIKYCSQSSIGMDCSPGTAYSVTATNNLDNTGDFYKKLSTSSFRVCDRRYPAMCQ